MATVLNGMMLHGGVRYLEEHSLYFLTTKSCIKIISITKLACNICIYTIVLLLVKMNSNSRTIEHLASLRTIPNTYVFRPADATETQAAWYLAQNVNDKPTSIVLTVKIYQF